ncbi:MAG TPA: FixH family protein [Clostridia bacterium]|nr:FixH family protein [Clostridia bacterium]
MSYAPFVILSLAVALLAGCNTKSELKSSGAGEARAVAKATQNPIQMALTTEPQKAQAQKPFTMRVHVTNQSGVAINDAALQGELTMKTMDHGKQQLGFATKGNGDYEAAGKAAMSGPWQLKVTAKLGAEIVEQNFDVNVID